MTLPVKPPIAPMLAKLADEIPVGKRWLYEPKWDGFRAVVFKDGQEVRLLSRDDRPLGRYFPELVSVLRAAPVDRFVTDGEIVVVMETGLGFDELLQRIHPAESRVRKLAAEWPATLVLFDALARDDRDLRSLPFAERRAELVRLLRDAGANVRAGTVRDLRPGPELALTPQTDDLRLATTWFEDEEGVGQDGIVAKPADLPYRSGERAMVKVKHHRTADCVVGGYRPAKAGGGVGSLLLGLYDEDGALQFLGHTSSFTAAERRDVRELVRPLEGGESFGQGRTPGGPSRWSAGRDSSWVNIQPTLVCEVQFDRLQGGRFRHAARFLRWRPDRDPRSCTFGQLLRSPPA